MPFRELDQLISSQKTPVLKSKDIPISQKSVLVVLFSYARISHGCLKFGRDMDRFILVQHTVDSQNGSVECIKQCLLFVKVAILQMAVDVNDSPIYFSQTHIFHCYLVDDPQFLRQLSCVLA